MGPLSTSPHMGRAEVAAVVGRVLQEFGAYCLEDVVSLIKDDDGRAHILNVLQSDACRSAAAQASAHGSAPVAHVTLSITVSPPPPPPINVVLQVAVPMVPTADVGTATESCSTRTAQAQTAPQLVWRHDSSADRHDSSQHGGSQYDDGGHYFYGG